VDLAVDDPDLLGLHVLQPLVPGAHPLDQCGGGDLLSGLGQLSRLLGYEALHLTGVVGQDLLDPVPRQAVLVLDILVLVLLDFVLLGDLDFIPSLLDSVLDVLLQDLPGLGVHLHHEIFVRDIEIIEKSHRPQSGVRIVELTEPEGLKFPRRSLNSLPGYDWAACCEEMSDHGVRSPLRDISHEYRHRRT